MLIESLIVVAALVFAAEESKPATAEEVTTESDGKSATKSASLKTTKTFALWPVEQEVIDRTNAERKRYGLPPLVVDTSLIQSARKHAFWMASARVLQHASGAWAENIAQGQTTASHAVSSWMNSSGHRANILNRRHRRIGVAGYRSSGGDIFWCQQFLE
ncbi:MAG: CAP domain-containing protein [Pirellulales bacterium]